VNRKLKVLAAKLAEVCWDGGSLDGAELQDLLVAAEILVAVIADQPCGSNCRCSECNPMGPWVCYRLNEGWR
jgi:hypothetical protein